MNLILTMAGKYSRFKLFGSNVPKYLLPLGSGTVLVEIIKNLLASKSFNEIYLIANKQDQLFYPVLKSILQIFNIPVKNLIYIDDTRSQLETAIHASNLMSKEAQNSPVVIMNIDTVTRNRGRFFRLVKESGSDEGVVDVFNASSLQYSFVHPGDNFSVLSISDAKAVSNLACSGLYGFGSFDAMERDAIELMMKSPGANFTKLYNYMIEKNKKIMFHESGDKRDTVVLGTPEEYVINMHRFKQ